MPMMSAVEAPTHPQPDTLIIPRPILLLAILTALILFGWYLTGSVQASGVGAPLMPVDDAYIHFQYARQIAAGQPYAYNPGLPPSSGATSLLYPYVLAVGYLIGFQGLTLGVWAMGIGAVTLLLAGLAVYRIQRLLMVPTGLAAAGMLAFMIGGAVTWHAFSGMETGLMLAFSLWTLAAILGGEVRAFSLWATLLALTRPEGSIMAVLAAGVWGAADVFGVSRARVRHAVPLLLPVLAAGVQPLVNLALTGTLSAAGNQAKSLFGIIPAYPDEILRRVLANIGQMVLELLTGVNPDGILYLPPLLLLLALIGMGRYISRTRCWLPGLVLLLWFAVLIVAISTLDTAFWHFKRYQMPLLGLLFPLALAAFAGTDRRLRLVVIGYIGLASVVSAAGFYGYYQQNVRSVAAQPLAMAQWLAANTPVDAVVAVHDVGMMRYLGDRTTVDMVGLTTPGAADAWRNGPGAAGEFLAAYEPRPDFVAAYTDARGLNYLAQTGVYGAQLTGFTATFDPRYNVALGGTFQGIFQPDWTPVDRAATMLQPSTQAYAAGMRLVDQVDVADLASEQAHGYQWQDAERAEGFATEFYQQTYVDCAVPACQVADGGRRINGSESFTLHVTPGEDLLLVTRVQPITAGVLRIYARETLIATRWLPAIPGQWLEIPTLIPAEVVTDATLPVRIIPEISGGYYQPYMHFVWQGNYQPAETALTGTLVTFQDGHIRAWIARPQIVTGADGGQRLDLQIIWETDGTATGDYLTFVHVYADSAQPPVAQAGDRRPGQGTLPPGNWLPGTLTDHFVVDLSQFSGGDYPLAFGLYDAQTQVRLLPELVSSDGSITIDAVNRRVLLDSLIVPEG